MDTKTKSNSRRDSTETKSNNTGVGGMFRNSLTILQFIGLIAALVFLNMNGVDAMVLLQAFAVYFGITIIGALVLRMLN